MPVFLKQSLGILFLVLVSIVIVEGYLFSQFTIPIIFGLFYNIIINGLTFLLGAFKTFKLPDNYYKIQEFEQQGKLYKKFGIDNMRKILKFSGTVNFNGRRSSLEKLEYKMLFAEKNHTICFALNLFTLTYLIYRNLWELIYSLMLFNFFLNMYPIVSQRYNRARIQLIKARLK